MSIDLDTQDPEFRPWANMIEHLRNDLKRTRYTLECITTERDSLAAQLAAAETDRSILGIELHGSKRETVEAVRRWQTAEAELTTLRAALAQEKRDRQRDLATCARHEASLLDLSHQVEKAKARESMTISALDDECAEIERLRAALAEQVAAGEEIKRERDIWEQACQRNSTMLFAARAERDSVERKTTEEIAAWLDGSVGQRGGVFGLAADIRAFAWKATP